MDNNHQIAAAEREHRPVYAVVSTDIRRDLVGPMRHFRRLEISHLFRRATYGDLTGDDLDPTLRAYTGPRDLTGQLWRLRPDLVQGVEPFAARLLPYLYSVYAVARARRTPLVVVTLENRPLARKHGPAVARVLRTALRPVFRYARAIVCLNDGAARNVRSVGPFDDRIARLMYGTWGVDVDEFTPASDAARSDSGATVLFVGRLHEEKGVFDLLDAFGRVRSRHPEARLELVGDGPARDALARSIANRGLADAVTLRGTLKNRDLPDVFRRATVFCAPSVTTRRWEEQVGMTNIQALACGVPVVTTRSGAIPEYVPDSAGILVSEGSPDELAHAIGDVLADPSRRRALAQAGREYAVAEYDARQNVHAAEEFLLALLARPNVSARDLAPATGARAGRAQIGLTLPDGRQSAEPRTSP